MPKTKQKSNSSPKPTKLPEDFRYLFWGYDFASIDPSLSKRLIIVNTLNYGNWSQWHYLVRLYGKEDLRKTIEKIPKSEFRPQVVKLIKLLFGIKEFQYASRGAKIKAERGL